MPMTYNEVREKILSENPHLKGKPMTRANFYGMKADCYFVAGYGPSNRVTQGVECFNPITGERLGEGFL